MEVMKRICLQCRRPRFDPWVGKIPWRRERLPTPVFWPREFHGLYSPWGRKESDTTECIHVHSKYGSNFTFFIFLIHIGQFVPSIQFSCSVMSNSLWPRGLQHARPPCPSPRSPSSESLLKLMSIESVMPSNHLILCHPHLLMSSIFPSIRDFSSESVLCIRWLKFWRFSFCISLRLNPSYV